MVEHTASLSFVGGTIIMDLMPGTRGNCRFIFDEADVDMKPHDEKEGSYLEIRVSRTEMGELLNWLTFWLEGKGKAL